MAEKPFIAARLRNPAEEAAAKILSFIVAAVTTFLLYTEWDQLSQYIGRGLGA